MTSNLCRINGIGAYVPSRVIDNAYLATLVDTSDEWITSRTGIKERRMAAPGEFCSDLALAATKEALKRSGVAKERISHVILGTCSGDCVFPSTASIVAHKLGLKDIPAFDISAACSGFLYSLEIARGFAAQSADACVLVLAAEVLTPRCNWKDRSTCVLFGDGGGACLVTGPEFPRGLGLNAELADIITKADGAYTDLLYTRAGGSSLPYKAGDVISDEYFIQMDGREVYKHAVRNMTDVSLEILARNGLSGADIDLVIPHQANQRIIEAVTNRLRVAEERVFLNVQFYGNTSAASIPLALYEAENEGRLRPGMNVLITTFGAGFTWAAALLKVE
jgi:3-oxoacyl-[acyl-carrier-protein] synthase-3